VAYLAAAPSQLCEDYRAAEDGHAAFRDLHAAAPWQEERRLQHAHSGDSVRCLPGCGPIAGISPSSPRTVTASCPWPARLRTTRRIDNNGRLRGIVGPSATRVVGGPIAGCCLRRCRCTCRPVRRLLGCGPIAARRTRCCFCRRPTFPRPLSQVHIGRHRERHPHGCPWLAWPRLSVTAESWFWITFGAGGPPWLRHQM